jgi:two-component system, NarL family, nitrate/nitrite response regulator NarL
VTEPAGRVLIIDDHRLFSEVIRSTLEGMGMQVLAAVTTGVEGIDMARRHRPEVVLVDIGLPDESGLSVGRKILEELPETKVVAVTSLIDPRAVAEAVRLGFRGYVTKDTPVNQFVSSIQAVLDGNVVMPKQLARQAAGDRSPEEQHAAILIKQLTDRERQVLQLLAEGSSGIQIAARLSISPNTVRTHVQSILTKLQVHSRLEAAAFAVRHGLIRTPGDRRSNS